MNLEKCARPFTRELFQVLAASRQKAAIIDQNGQTYTRGDLLREILTLHEALAERPAAQSGCIAVWCREAVDLARAIAGAMTYSTCMPLSPQASIEQVAAAIEQAGARLLLTDRAAEAADLAHLLAVQVISLTPAEPLIENTAASRLEKYAPPVPRENNIPALLLMSSGSTGPPKLVAITQENVLHSARMTAQSLALTDTDRCLILSPFQHAMAIIAGFAGTLLSGGTVIIPPRYVPACFHEWLAKFQPTWWSASPTVHASIVKEIRRKPLPPHVTVRVIRSSGLKLPRITRRDLENLFRVPVVETYGLTECFQSTATEIAFPISSDSVGKGLGCEISIRDESGNCVEEGKSGEVCIRGANVCRGYWNNASATQAACWGEWFRTGDVGWLDPCGELRLNGRTSDLINKGGTKIWPEHIEEAIEKLPAVAAAAVFSIPHPTYGEDIAALVVLKKGFRLTAADIQNYLGGSLQQPSIPTAIQLHDAIALNAQGKKVRAECRRIFQERQEESAPPRAWNVTEIFQMDPEIMREWARLLGNSLNELDPDADFFLAGGDSITACELLLFIENHSGIRLSFQELQAHSTLRRLSRFLACGGNNSRTLLQVGGVTATVMQEATEQGGALLVFVAPFLSLAREDFGDVCKALSDRISVIGLEYSAASRDSSFDIRSISKRYAQIVTRLAHERPLHLLGFSSGARIAFHVAAELSHRGVALESVTLLEAAPIPQWTPPWRCFLSLRNWKSLRAWIETWRERRHLQRMGAPGWAFHKFARDIAAYKSFFRSQLRQRLPHYSGSINVVADGNARFLDIDPTFGWRDYCSGQIQVSYANCARHGDCVRGGQVPILAEYLEKTLMQPQIRSKPLDRAGNEQRPPVAAGEMGELETNRVHNHDPIPLDNQDVRGIEI
jgi:oxalate---CoA ligase